MKSRVARFLAAGCVLGGGLGGMLACADRGGHADPAGGNGTWPPPNLTLITHSSPGGGGDVLARELARTLDGMFGTTVTIDNRVGGSGAVATVHLARRARPDGSVLQVVTPTQLITQIQSRGIPSFRDVTPIARLVLDPTVLYVRRESPFATIDELIRFARRNPGQLTFGIGSAGSLDHIVIEEVMRAAEIRVRTVPHEGGGDAMISVLGGHIDAGLGEPVKLLPQIRSGNLRVLTFFDDERSADYPDVPAFEELGYEVVSHKFRGVWGPPGMSPSLVDRIAEVLGEAVDTEPFRTYYRSGSMRRAILVGDDFTHFLDEMNSRLSEFMAAR